MITELTDRCLAAEVPDDSKEWMLTTIHADLDLVCANPKGNGMLWLGEITQPGNWLILGRPNELSEEQWGRMDLLIKDWHSHVELYYNYTASARDFRDIIEAGFTNAKESGLSLLKSKNVNPDNVIILIKQ